MATSSLDGIPPENTPVASGSASWMPIVSTSANQTEPHVPVFGLGGNLP